MRRTLLLFLSALALGFSSPTGFTDAQSRVLSACEDAADFSPARTPDGESFDFAAWEATVFTGARVKGNSLRWHVRPSTTTQTSARLALSRPPQYTPERIALWVKNPNAHDLALHLEIIDADGAIYRSPPVGLLDEAGWREAAFDVREMTAPFGDPSPGIDAPIVRMAFVIDGLAADRPYTIYLDEIATTERNVETLSVTNLRCQTSLGPGEPLPVHADISPIAAVGRTRITAELASTTGGAVAWAPLQSAEGNPTATAILRVPEWATPGRYEVRLVSDSAETTLVEPIGVVIGGATPPRVVASIAAGFSPPAISLGEINHRPVVEELRGSLPFELSEDVTIVALPATTDTHPFAWAPPPTVDDDGMLSFAGLDRRAAAVLNARPNAALVLQVFIDATADWEDAHPEHLQHFDGNTFGPNAIFAGDRTHPDILSATWQTGADERLRALVRHVEHAPWRHRVIGYELQAGDLGAWRPWGASLGIGDDTTSARQEAFLAWLHNRYSDVEALRAGWLGRRRGFGRPREGFESVVVPLPLEDVSEPSLYDPAADQPMIDLLHCKAEATADALLAMAAAVREEAGADTLIGGCYGHLLAHARANDWAWPHTALTYVLESGTLDFMTGPQMRIDDTTQPSSLGESIRRAGMLYLERAHGAEAVAADCGALVTAGSAGELSRLPNPEAPSPGTTVIEVVDDVSARYLSGDAALPRDLLARPISGAISHEMYLLRDLLQPNPPQGDIYVFRDIFAIEPEQGRLLARNTARDGALLVWIYAPGAIDRHLITGRTMQYLTGIKLSPLARRGRVTVKPESSLLGTFGLPHSVNPVFISVDEDAEWLGTIAGSGPARCGFALRKFPHCTSVFSVAPPSEEVLRHLAKRSNIEIAPPADG